MTGNEGPPFVLSYPVHVLMNGIVFAFIVSLLVHVIFTAVYHFPLNRMNFLLQLASCLLMLIMECTKIGITLSRMSYAGSVWPFMFPFMAPRLPNASRWPTVQTVFYSFLQMITLLSSHVRPHDLCRPRISNSSRCYSRRSWRRA